MGFVGRVPFALSRSAARENNNPVALAQLDAVDDDTTTATLLSATPQAFVDLGVRTYIDAFLAADEDDVSSRFRGRSASSADCRRTTPRQWCRHVP
jgi:hypothetical protein